jgi:uncharacterized membrane protein
MVTKKEKDLIGLIGFFITCLGIAAFFWLDSYGFMGQEFEVYTYREYALPVSIFGIIILVIGLVIPGKDPISVSNGEITPTTVIHTNQRKAENETDPLKILQIRLAKGEITKEEYEELTKMLGN